MHDARGKSLDAGFSCILVELSLQMRAPTYNPRRGRHWSSIMPNRTAAALRHFPF
jgi:hypothetical protein